MTAIERDMELEARLLRDFLGWRWLRVKAGNRLCGLFPPHGEGEWEMSPMPEVESHVFEVVEGVPSNKERMSDWFNCCIQNLAKHTWRSGMPALSIDIRHSCMLKAELVGRGYSIKSRLSSGGVSVAITKHFSVGSDVVMSFSPSAEAMALCLAADGLPRPLQAMRV